MTEFCIIFSVFFFLGQGCKNIVFLMDIRFQ